MAALLQEIQNKILPSWGSLYSSAHITHIAGGLLNDTFLVQKNQEKSILQRINRIFSPLVNENAQAVTQHLQTKGIATPTFIKTSDKKLYLLENDNCWRMMTWMPGHTLHALPSVNYAMQAGRLVGQFHVALADFEFDYVFIRASVHDTKAHLKKLEHALLTHQQHRLFAIVAPLAEQIIKEAEYLPDFSSLPKRHCHGDLKISNLLFNEDGTGVCLIDLDTLTKFPWPIEMGDALRSWCNPNPEDQVPAYFDIDLFRAALEGYMKVANVMLQQEEKAALVDGITTITLELSSRFLADALLESYFGFDASRFATRGEHNLLKAKGQWSLYCDIKQKRSQLEEIVRQL